MSVGAILTLGLGQFGTVNLLPTLGYLSSSTPPAPPVSPSTPGFIRHLPALGRQIRGETDDEKLARRIREGSIPAPAADDGRLAQYTEKSEKVAAAIERLRTETARTEAEAATLRLQIEQEKRARAQERLQKALLLKEQALTLARAQEAALIEELTAIDIAYVSVIALGVILQ